MSPVNRGDIPSCPLWQDYIETRPKNDLSSLLSGLSTYTIDLATYLEQYLDGHTQEIRAIATQNTALDYVDQDLLTTSSPDFATPSVTSLITAGDIGVVSDTDLLQLAANALTVNGNLTLTNDTTTVTYGDAGVGDKISFVGRGTLLNSFEVTNAAANNDITLNLTSTTAVWTTDEALNLVAEGRGMKFTADTATFSIELQSPTIILDGNVGIGTTAPDSIFHIKANVPGTVGSHPAGQLIIQDPDDTVFGNAVITGYESDGAGNPDQQLWYLGSSSSSNSAIIFLNRRNSKLQLGTNGVSRLTILGNGNVGINDTAPAEKLDVDGNINVTGVLKVDDVQVVKEQQAHIADAPGDTTANNATTINAILVALETHGLLASS